MKVLYSKLEQEYHHLSLWYFVSFIFGIIFFFRFAGSLPNYFFFVSLPALLTLTIFFRKRNLLIFFAIACAFSFCVGMLAAGARVSSAGSSPLTRAVTAEITGDVEIIKPTLRGMQITLNDVSLKYDKRFSRKKSIKSLKRVRINVANKIAADLSYGDNIKLRAKLFPLQGAVLPGAYDFGFYMRMSSIEASGYALTEPEIIEKNSSFFNEYIQDIRRAIYRILLSELGTKNGNFAAAILIGETKAIPKDIAENMRNSGVAHILSVSGLHLSLVAMIFFVCTRVMLNCSNYFAYNTNIKLISAVVSIVGSFLYLKISGGNIAATRAFIMTAIFIIAMMIGRVPYPLRSVMIAAFLILIFLPEYVFHPSFQLSFTAVLCLISGYEFYLRHKHILGASKGVVASVKFYIFTNIYSSFLASIVTAPFVVYHFYKFATYSVLMNLIAVPLMSFFMMPLALLAVLLMPFGIAAWPLQALGFFVGIITASAGYIVDLPGSVWSVGHVSPLSLMLFAMGFFWVCLWQTRWRFWGVVIMIASTYMMLQTPKPDFIYDHNLKAVGVKNSDGDLEIYLDKDIPKFTTDYWVSWYGQKDVVIHRRKLFARDAKFTLPSGKVISLNYWRCSNADVQIVVSKKLKCNRGQVIPNSELWNHKQVLLYCHKDRSECSAKYGKRK